MPDREGKPFELTSTGPAARIDGMQGQAWGEIMRTDQQFEYMVYPRLLALAERAGTGRDGSGRIERGSATNWAKRIMWTSLR
jgi:N-acetyl-beta-hexosaminidase